MQQVGSIQALSIAFIQTLFLTYLILNKPLSNQYEHYKSLITETLIIFNAVTFIFYAFRVEMNLTLPGCINLGWLHIFTSTMILAVSLIFDLIQQVKVVIQKVKIAIQGPVKEEVDQIILFY